MKDLFAYFLVLLLSLSGCTTQDVPKDNFNIVLITIDTLRADYLSCYGYERKTSPNIDKVAEKGILLKML
jgi:glucan phosphoethanolaminetransferase (alkaline phosphatase superfamily)